MVRDLEALKAGKALFAGACSACHGVNGEGGHGPNLTESHEVRRASDEDLFRPIRNGVRDAIVPDESEGEAPLMPITNRYKPMGTTSEVDFKTTRASHATMKSHIDQVVLDTSTWESSAGFRLESSDAVQLTNRHHRHRAAANRWVEAVNNKMLVGSPLA
jgi:hypothetical protein